MVCPTLAITLVTMGRPKATAITIENSTVGGSFLRNCRKLHRDAIAVAILRRIGNGNLKGAYIFDAIGIVASSERC
jgi:hypothetical protein